MRFLVAALCAFFAAPACAAGLFPTQTDASRCVYRRMDAGAFVELQSDEDVSISQDHRFIVVQNERESWFRLYDAATARERKIAKQANRKVVIHGDREVLVPRSDAVVALDVVSFAERRVDGDEAPRDGGKLISDEHALDRFRVDAHGRTIAISRLYAGSYVLKISPPREAYAAFRDDLLKGVYCGRPFTALGATKRARIAKQAHFLLWDQLTEDRIRNIFEANAHKDIIRAFMKPAAAEDLVEIYAYRLTERGRQHAVYAKVDTMKLHTFASLPFFKLVGSELFSDVTDVSVLQRDGALNVFVLSSQPFDGGAFNEFGFYLRFEGERQVKAIAEKTAMNLAWREQDKEYNAQIDLIPPLPTKTPAIRSFPAAAKTGLVLLDATFSREESSTTFAHYKDFYQQAGFVFARPEAVADLKGFIRDRIGAGLQYFVKEGHADGDDENLATVTRAALLHRGVKSSPSGEETVWLVERHAKPGDLDTIAYRDFMGWLASTADKRLGPLVYFNTTCWGYDKSWLSLGVVAPEHLVEIASDTASNMIDEMAVSATKIIIDGIRHGADFEATRKALGGILEIKNRHGDTYILPDDPAYAHASRIVRVERALSVKSMGRTESYKPDGYFD